MEAKSARVLLEQGEPIPIPAPFLFRLFGKKTILLTLKMPTADTCLRAINYRLKMNISDEEFESLTIEQALTYMAKHSKDTARIAAIVILESKFLDFCFGKWLSGRLLKILPFSVLYDIMELVTIGGGLEDFMNIIGLTKWMRLMKRNNPSQKIQRS